MQLAPIFSKKKTKTKKKKKIKKPLLNIAIIHLTFFHITEKSYREVSQLYF